MNILITSAGRRVSLVRIFQKELNHLFPGAKVFAADNKPAYSSACQVADGAFKVSRVTTPEYIDELISICHENSIRLIIPTIDTELLSLASAYERFKTNGIECLVSDEELVKMCRDKRKTHDFFKSHGTNHARENKSDDIRFPCFVKPADGSSSVNISILHSAEDLTESMRLNPKLMFLEYLDLKAHTEFTLDLYYDRNSVLRCAVPRERIETRAGEVSKGITRKNELVDHVFNHYGVLEGFRGCITMQLFLNNQTKEITGIEINPRFGGGYPLSYAAGANYPKWIIEEYLLNKPVETYIDWEENLLMLRYDDEILIHGFKD